MADILRSDLGNLGLWRLKVIVKSQLLSQDVETSLPDLVQDKPAKQHKFFVCPIRPWKLQKKKKKPFSALFPFPLILKLCSVGVLVRFSIAVKSFKIRGNGKSVGFPLLWRDTMTKTTLQRTTFNWGWLTGSEVQSLIIMSGSKASKPIPTVMHFLQQGNTYSNQATPPNSATSHEPKIFKPPQ